MDGFVDDTTIWQNSEHPSQETTIQAIAVRLQIAAQWWEQLLHATGGQFELPKCFYYPLHWVFDSEGCARLTTPDELDIQISIRQSADEQEIDIAQRRYGNWWTRLLACGAKGKDNFVNERDRILEDTTDIDDYFGYEQPLDFVSAAERR
jgi:hypothetical protein